MKNITKLKNYFKDNLKENYNIGRLTWFKTTAFAKYFILLNCQDDLVFFLQNYPKDMPFYIIGAGSNLLIRDGGINGIVLKFSPTFNNISLLSEDTIKVTSSVLDVTVSNFAKDNNIGGFEFLVGIPGSIGGAIAMNAGCFNSEIKNILTSATAIDYNGNITIFTNQELSMSYRVCSKATTHIFLEAQFKGFKKQKDEIALEMANIKRVKESNQPKNFTAGSTFKNPTGNLKAWQLIENAGLKGYKYNQAEVSQQHANFLINKGDANSSDIEHIINHIIAVVLKKTGILLEKEVKILGDNLK